MYPDPTVGRNTYIAISAPGHNVNINNVMFIMALETQISIAVFLGFQRTGECIQLLQLQMVEVYNDS